MRVKLTLLAALSLGWTTAVNGVETGSKKSAESDIMQVLATTPTLDLLRVAQAYAEGLDAAEARAHVLRFEAQRSMLGDMVGTAAFQRWGELEPAAALARADSSLSAERVENINYVMRGWAKRAPAEAWEKLGELSSGFTDLRYDAGHPFTLLAEQDLNLAAAKFQEMPARRQCLECLANNLCMVAFARGRAAMIEALLAAMPEGEHRAALRDTYWEFTGLYEQARGWKKLSAWGTASDRMAAELNLLEGWTEVDFGASYEQAMSLQPKTRRDAALGVVLQRWARGARSSEVAEIIPLLPDDLGEKVVLGLAAQFGNLNPAATMAWAEVLQTPSLREEVQSRVIRAWTALAPEAARDYIRRQTDLDIRGILLWSYLFRRLDNHTLTVEDFDEILPRFAPSWKVNLLSRLVVQLVDPRAQSDGFIARSAVIEKINGRTDLLPEQRKAILKPLAAH